MPNLTTSQAALAAVVNQAVNLLIGFAVLNSTTAGIVENAAIAVLNAAFVIGQAVENHGKAKATAGPAVVVNTPAAAPAKSAAK